MYVQNAMYGQYTQESKININLLHTLKCPTQTKMNTHNMWNFIFLGSHTHAR